MREALDGICCTVLQVAKVADLTDTVNPHLHFFLGLGHQIECTGRSLNNKHKIILKFLPNEAGAHMLPHCTLAEVYHTDGLARVLVPVVLQDVRVAIHAASPEDKPTLAPGQGTVWVLDNDVCSRMVERFLRSSGGGRAFL